MKYTNDGIGRAIHGESLADGGFAGEQLVTRFYPQHDHPPHLPFIADIHQPAFLNRKRAKALVFRPHSAHRTRCRVVTAHLGHASPQLRDDRLDQVAFRLNELSVVHGKTNDSPGCVAPSLSAGSSAPDNGEIDADGLEMFFLIPAESLTQTYQQNDGSDSPYDPEHGQEAAKFVGFNRTDSLAARLPGCSKAEGLRFLDVLQGHT